MKLMRQATLVMLLLVMGTGGCDAGSDPGRIAVARHCGGRHGLARIYKIEDALEAASGGKYFVDGHECGQRHTCSSMPKTPRST